jgi:glycosyltransferase involved in cell wall biosynthesis
MSVSVSVIIPCYNQGQYIHEALKSVADCNVDGVEIIVINDGSTDLATNEILTELKARGVHVVFQANTGLAGARNAGIRLAKGKFILPLDADNKIRPAYLLEGVKIMQEQPDTAVVFGNASYFGQKTGDWIPGRFNLQKLMISNYIDACALIRKSVLEQVGLYDQNMKFMGWEDWDLWLAIAFKGHQFSYLDQVAFDYRVENISMIRDLYNKYEKPNYLENYIHEKYSGYMGHQWIMNYFKLRFKKNPLMFITKLIITVYFPRYHKVLLEKNKIRNGL